MINYFYYSILQYKHSLTLGEILNVGILFYFPEDRNFEFIDGDGTRAKAIYPDFDTSIFNSYIRAIQQKVKIKVDLFREAPVQSEFISFIKKNILSVDAAGLIFNEPVQIKNVFLNREILIREYSKQLLPGINTERSTINKHNESFILRTFNGYLYSGNNEIEKKLTKNKIIKTNNNFEVKFDLCWQNKYFNLVKPLSFDLNEVSSINQKSFQYYGLFNALKDSKLAKNSRFDFLVSKPQNPSLIKTFENALDYIESVKIDKKLILEDSWEDYSQEIKTALG